MKLDKPLVSIGMPVYNGEEFIQQALDSLLAQDYEHFELIISDNASLDRTEEICREYAARDGRISYYRNEQNRGPAWNFGRVLDLARGEYFIWAAHDDIWEPSFVSTLAGLLEASHEAVLAFCDFDSIDVHGAHARSYPHIGGLFGIRTRLSQANRYMWFKEENGKANLICGLMRPSAIRSAFGLPVPGPVECGLDMLIMFRLALMGDFVQSKHLLFHKRLVPGTGSFAPWTFADWHAYRGAYRQIVIRSNLAWWEKLVLAGSATHRQLWFWLREEFARARGRIRAVLALIVGGIASLLRSLGTVAR